MPIKLVTAEQMRGIDHATIEGCGVSAFSLMEEAGRTVAQDVADNFETGTAIILAGKGNNGGDGYVAARHLARARWLVSVVFIDQPIAGAAREAWDLLPEEVSCKKYSELEQPTEYFANFDVAIDALLGTGSDGKLRQPYDDAVAALNNAHLPVFSVDIPTGLHPDQGTTDRAVLAYRTITIGLPKVGMVTADGPKHCGKVRVAPLFFPKEVIEQTDSRRWSYMISDANHDLPGRPMDGHKGTFGTVLVIAGSAAIPGAAMLSLEGAMRAGCGLVRLLSPSRVRNLAIQRLPEILLSDACDTEAYLAPVSEVRLEEALDRVRCVLIGPGIDVRPDSLKLLEQVLSLKDLPIVIDADALTMIARNPSLGKKLGPPHVLTPHPGEMGRLLKMDTAKVQEDRWAAARQAAATYGCNVLLKGFGTLLAEPDGNVTHIASGNTAWARGGAGDVLAGVISGLVAQGAKPETAAKLGAFVHGLAADTYTREHSPRGALTLDVARFLPLAFREIERSADKPWG